MTFTIKVDGNAHLMSFPVIAVYQLQNELHEFLQHWDSFCKCQCWPLLHGLLSDTANPDGTSLNPVGTGHLLLFKTLITTLTVDDKVY